MSDLYKDNIIKGPKAAPKPAQAYETKAKTLEFESKESDINILRSKIEQKIKVIQLIRTDDAYKN